MAQQTASCLLLHRQPVMIPSISASLFPAQDKTPPSSKLLCQHVSQESQEQRARLGLPAWRDGVEQPLQSDLEGYGLVLRSCQPSWSLNAVSSYSITLLARKGGRRMSTRLLGTAGISISVVILKVSHTPRHET